MTATAQYDHSAPAAIQARLNAIDMDLASRQNALEAAARAWFIVKRDREKEYAVEYMKADGPVEARKAQAIRATSHIGAREEAEYEALKAVVRVLETRASIGQSLLRSQGRA